MRLEDLRNPLPNIRKAYSPNFSNTVNESSDEKGAAMVSESGILGLLKFIAPLFFPDPTDAFYPDLFDFDRPAGGDPNMDSPFDADGLAPVFNGDDYYNDPFDMISPERPGGNRPTFGPEMDLPPDHPFYVPRPTNTPAPPPPSGPYGVGRGMHH